MACAASTRRAAVVTEPVRYRLAKGTALRREAFGGIAYSHVTRRLSLIYSVLAVDVALLLDEGSPLDEVIRYVAAIPGGAVITSELEIRRAVGCLAASGILVALDATAPDHAPKPHGRCGPVPRRV